MQKRGQIGLFVIIAIVVIAIILFFVLYRGNLSLSQGKYSADMDSVREYTQSCAQQALEEANQIVGVQGGYYNLPMKHFISNLSDIAYWYYEGKKIAPEKVKIESEISSYINDSLIYCFEEDYFSGIELSTRNPIVKTKIDLDKVTSSIEFRIFLTKEDNTVELDKDYTVQVNSKLGGMYDVASKIVDDEVKNLSILNVSYLLDQEFSTTGLVYGEKEIVYVLDYQNQTSNESYMFRFANRFR